MAMHTVNRSPFQHSTLADCLKVIASNDVILLLEDGVYGALSSSPQWQSLSPLVNSERCYALDDDLKARGIAEQISDEINIISMSEFVELSTQHNPIRSWF